MLLPLLIFIPFFGGLLCWKFDKYHNQSIINWIALFFSFLTLILSCTLLIYNTNCNNITLIKKNLILWKLKFFFPWIENLGINFELALDGLSLIMILLSSFLVFIAIIFSINDYKKKKGIFYFNIFWILSNIIGILLSINMFLFFIFWEMMLIPTYFLIVLWGNKKFNIKKRIFTATKFFLYTQLGGVIMLICILTLAYIHYQTYGFFSFSYENLLKLKLPYCTEYILMLGFFIAFAVKMPIVFLHGWLPESHNHSPTNGALDITGILLKVSVYGLIRFNLSLFPNASFKFSEIAMILGIINIFYGSWMAFSQNNIKRLIAYASISHMGFILIGIYSKNEIALQGVVIQMILNSLSTAALFLISGKVYKYLNTFNLIKLSGTWGYIKWLPAFMLFFTISNLGIPGTGNFIGELMILIGSFKNYPIIVLISLLGIIFSSIYSVNLIQKFCFGEKKFNKEFFSNIINSEFFILILLSLLIVLIGFYPKIILNIFDTSITNIHEYFINSIFLSDNY